MTPPNPTSSHLLPTSARRRSPLPPSTSSLLPLPREEEVEEVVKGPETVDYSTTARAEVNSSKTTTTTTTTTWKASKMIKFKNAIVSNYWKLKKVPWAIVVADGFKSHRAPVADVTLEIESGPDVSRMTATRVLAGGVLLGPVGMILGGMAKKADANNNLVITFPDAVVRIPFTPREYKDVQAFIAEVVRRQA